MSSFLLSGPTALCAEDGLDELDSFTQMEANGWNMTMINEYRLVLPDEFCKDELLPDKDGWNKWDWMIQGWSTTMISTEFWGPGRVDLTYGNCNLHGDVTVLVDGNEVGRSKPNGIETKAIFNVAEGSTMTIQTDSRSIIKLFDLDIKCGN